MKNEYRCSNCECEFDEPEFICEREVIDYGIGREWITLFEGEVCPYCESMEFEPVCEEESESLEREELTTSQLQDYTSQH